MDGRAGLNAVEKRKSNSDSSFDRPASSLVALPTELSRLLQINIDAVFHSWD
jgi:hypothetical protein